MPASALASIAPDPVDDRRLDLRRFVDMNPVLLEGETCSEHVQIINIARLGFLARSRLHYRTGETIQLHLQNIGNITARLVWSARGMVGGRFLEAIDINQIIERGDTVPPSA